jgi:hypothetical protein
MRRRQAGADGRTRLSGKSKNPGARDGASRYHPSSGLSRAGEARGFPSFEEEVSMGLLRRLAFSCVALAILMCGCQSREAEKPGQADLSKMKLDIGKSIAYQAKGNWPEQATVFLAGEQAKIVSNKLGSGWELQLSEKQEAAIKEEAAKGNAHSDHRDVTKIVGLRTITPDGWIDCPSVAIQDAKAIFAATDGKLVLNSITVHANKVPVPDGPSKRVRVHVDNRAGPAGTLSIGKMEFPLRENEVRLVRTVVPIKAENQALRVNGKELGTIDRVGDFVLDCSGKRAYEKRVATYGKNNITAIGAPELLKPVVYSKKHVHFVEYVHYFLEPAPASLRVDGTDNHLMATGTNRSYIVEIKQP